MNEKNKIYILDTSVILSGKPIIFNDHKFVTTPGVSSEISSDDRDYQNFQYLKESGLEEYSPSDKSVKEIKKIILKTGDIDRLSSVDIGILALAFDLKKNDNLPVILTDDYSIQNVAEYLNLDYQGLNQLKITKKFKWICRCRGCGKKFNKNIRVCPICGTETKKTVSRIEDV